jgi:hypothetical protein
VVLTKDVAEKMKKLLEFIIKCLREGIPLGKGALEFWLLVNPFLRRTRGSCPLCHTVLWEQMPQNAVEVMEKHLKSCPKAKEKEASK